MFDTHAHLNLTDYAGKEEEIINKCLKNEIAILNAGVDYKSSQLAVAITKEYLADPIYAAVGLQPSCIGEGFDCQKYQNIINESPKKVVAIGEIGLDYGHLEGMSEEKRILIQQKQKQILIHQINFAFENDLPIIIHLRNGRNNKKASEDLIDILINNYNHIKKNSGVIHCYTYGWELAKKFLDLNLYLGFTGILTYDESVWRSASKKADILKIHEVVKKTPLDRILSETDCPYLLPEPLKTTNKKEINSPLNLPIILKKIAQIRKAKIEDINSATTENAKKLFHV